MSPTVASTYKTNSFRHWGEVTCSRSLGRCCDSCKSRPPGFRAYVLKCCPVLLLKLELLKIQWARPRAHRTRSGSITWTLSSRVIKDEICSWSSLILCATAINSNT